MNEEPVWLPPDSFLTSLMVAIPELRLIRRDGFLSALEAPQTAFYYAGETNFYVLAGIYAQRLAKAHAFADCNKRSALIAATTFLELNGLESNAVSERTVETMVNIASGRATPQDFAALFR